jgi:hypothetical protein
MIFYNILYSTSKELQPLVAPDFNSAYQVDAPYSFWNLRSGEQAADWLKLPKLVLQNDARLTDLIDVVGFNRKFTLLCSKAFLNSLEKYTTTAYEVFPVPVFDGLKAQTYYLLNWFQASNELIDFPQSEFAIPPQWTSLNAKKVEQKVEVRDLEYYDQLKKEHLSVTASKIVLKPKVPYQLFRINAGLKHPFFVSGVLREQLEAQNLTGFAFQTL